jgi:AcrR family transcriptional regulator
MPRVIGGSLETHRSVTLERIYDAFTELLYERGYDSISLADVATQVGIARTAMYNYFPSKDALLVAYVGRESEVYLQHLKDSLARVDNPIDRLRIYLAEQLRYFASHHMPPGSALRVLLSKSAYGRVADHVVALEQLLREILDDAVAERYVEVDDLETTISLVVSCIHRAGTDEVASADMDAVSRSTEAFVLRALGVTLTADGRPRRHPRR